ncbi:MAG: phage head-tail joining protein [Inquilinaceae bacterium]
MATLDELTARRDALDAALATGTLTVRQADGKAVTYRLVEEMERIRAGLDRQIAALQGRPTVREIRIRSSKGL